MMSKCEVRSARCEAPSANDVMPLKTELMRARLLATGCVLLLASADVPAASRTWHIEFGRPELGCVGRSSSDPFFARSPSAGICTLGDVDRLAHIDCTGLEP